MNLNCRWVILPGLALSACSGGEKKEIVPAQATPQVRATAMSREQRIADHQKRIQEIISQNRASSASLNANMQQRIADISRQNRVISLNSQGHRPVPGFGPPDSFDSIGVKVLKAANVSDDQISKLRQLNNEAWELRLHDEDATSPETAAKVQRLVSEQDAVLSEEQKAGFQEQMTSQALEMRKRAQLSRTSSTLPIRN